ncbi:MAG: hypothetical protein KatS3mg011_2249 [Acidimicrobiia bacterium]|nr:MAG: hypothetical protein KatS3mg011_2249 [Acidimicrobiia bacterium]
MNERPADSRPLGVHIPHSDLRVGDHCDVSIEPRLLGERTGTSLTLRKVVYWGMDGEKLIFQAPMKRHAFASFEIIRVVLVDSELTS